MEDTFFASNARRLLRSRAVSELVDPSELLIVDIRFYYSLLSLLCVSRQKIKLKFILERIFALIQSWKTERDVRTRYRNRDRNHQLVKPLNLRRLRLLIQRITRQRLLLLE